MVYCPPFCCRLSLNPRIAMSSPLASWSVQQVLDWLNSQGLGEFTPTFANNSVDGLSLLQVCSARCLQAKPPRYTHFQIPMDTFNFPYFSIRIPDT